MGQEQLLDRISIDADVMTGKPVVRGTRLTVDYILNRLGHGESIGDIVAEYDKVTEDDVRACLLFASKCMSDLSFTPADSTAR